VSARRRAAGCVLLVGAGPGDPDLITLRGVAALRRADVVLHDDLAHPALLDFAPASARCIDVGKRGHDSRKPSQSDINQLLVEHAQAGRCVVRLKGGDPFVFGRGGEEASACAAAGVPFEVVPGVSSALGAPAFAGIPLTDRRFAASFAVLTGHSAPARPGDRERFERLATGADTLVVLMAMKNLAQLVDRLLAAGRDPETPAAVVMRGSLADQRVVEAPLVRLAEAARAEGLAAPAAVVVGDVVRLRESLRWWEEKPLFGTRVLVTRAAEQADDLVTRLRDQGADPVVVPMIRLEAPLDASALDGALAGYASYDAVVFTSSNAVRFVAERARERGVDLGSAGVRVLCIGPATARAALSAGIPVQLTASSPRGDAESLLKEICDFLPPEGRAFLLPHSDIAGDGLREGLREAGARVDAVVAYRTVRPEVDAAWLREELVSGQVRVLTFTSPSTVRHLFELLDDAAREALRHCTIAAVGPTTAAALRQLGHPPQVVPERPGMEELVAALARHVRERREGDE